MTDIGARLASPSQSSRRDSESVGWRGRRWLLYAVLSGLALVYVVPALLVVANAFRTYPDVARHGWIAWPHSFSLDAFADAWTKFCVSGTCNGIAGNFYNSLRITIPATLIATAIGAANGFVLSKWRVPGARLIFFAMLLGVFMPPQLALLPWAFVLGKLHLYNSFYGLILVHSVQGISFTTLFCRNFYTGISDNLIKAARIDGAGFWRIFWRIILPLSPPILVVTCVWEFATVWNDFLFGVVFTAGTEQPVTAALLSVRAGGQSAAVLIAALPPLLVFLVGGRYLARGLTGGHASA